VTLGLKLAGIVVMLGGFTVFVVGVFIAARVSSIIVSLVGVSIMLVGVAVTNHAQRSEIGPDL
jgi:hypothetical protein